MLFHKEMVKKGMKMKYHTIKLVGHLLTLMACCFFPGIKYIPAIGQEIFIPEGN